jgi:hypothetical protein
VDRDRFSKAIVMIKKMLLRKAIVLVMGIVVVVGIRVAIVIGREIRSVGCTGKRKSH